MYQNSQFSVDIIKKLQFEKYKESSNTTKLERGGLQFAFAQNYDEL